MIPVAMLLMLRFLGCSELTDDEIEAYAKMTGQEMPE